MDEIDQVALVADSDADNEYVDTGWSFYEFIFFPDILFKKLNKKGMRKNLKRYQPRHNRKGGGGTALIAVLSARYA